MIGQWDANPKCRSVRVFDIVVVSLVFITVRAEMEVFILVCTG